MFNAGESEAPQTGETISMLLSGKSAFMFRVVTCPYLVGAELVISCDKNVAVLACFCGEVHRCWQKVDADMRTVEGERAYIAGVKGDRSAVARFSV